MWQCMKLEEKVKYLDMARHVDEERKKKYPGK
jgi:hypothetical protein